MYEIITETQFIDRFLNSDTYKNNFSYEGLKTLFEDLEHYEEETKDNLEFGVVWICCEYSEYENEQELLNDYSGYESIEEIEDNTHILTFKKYGNDHLSYIIKTF